MRPVTSISFYIVGPSDNVTYFVEQIEDIKVSENFTKLFSNNFVILPDFGNKMFYFFNIIFFFFKFYVLNCEWDFIFEMKTIVEMENWDKNLCFLWGMRKTCFTLRLKNLSNRFKGDRLGKRVFSLDWKLCLSFFFLKPCRQDLMLSGLELLHVTATASWPVELSYMYFGVTLWQLQGSYIIASRFGRSLIA